MKKNGYWGNLINKLIYGHNRVEDKIREIDDRSQKIRICFFVIVDTYWIYTHIQIIVFIQTAQIKNVEKVYIQRCSSSNSILIIKIKAQE